MQKAKKGGTMTYSTTPSRGRLTRTLGLASAFLVALLLTTAHSASADAQTVTVRAQAIHATSNGNQMDGSLSSIAGQLRSRFGQYSSFSQLSDNRLSLSVGQSRSVRLPNGQTLQVTFQGMSGSSYRLNVSIPGGGSTVTIGRGGVFFVAGPNYQGGLLIVAVRI